MKGKYTKYKIRKEDKLHIKSGLCKLNITFWEAIKLSLGLTVKGLNMQIGETEGTFYKKVNRKMDIIYIESCDDDNPLCECPNCGKKGKLMDSFSLLANGFNGIKKGDKDDLDQQECGNCEAKLDW